VWIEIKKIFHLNKVKLTIKHLQNKNHIKHYLQTEEANHLYQQITEIIIHIKKFIINLSLIKRKIIIKAI
jgi:hypothetical protein